MASSRVATRPSREPTASNKAATSSPHRRLNSHQLLPLLIHLRLQRAPMGRLRPANMASRVDLQVDIIRRAITTATARRAQVVVELAILPLRVTLGQERAAGLAGMALTGAE